MTTTADRIQSIIEAGMLDFNARPACEKIAAEIDDLTERNAFLLTSAETAQAKLAEARVEVERLRPAAEAWEALEAFRPLFNQPLVYSRPEEAEKRAEIHAADQKYHAAAARARAAKEAKP